MCGILGTWHKDCPINHKNDFSKALDLLIKRGPDDKDLFIEKLNDGAISFGHRRLSIIDLTSGGHQPMHSYEKRYSIIFNGMIYNYKELKQELESTGIKFVSNSDTEVLLQSWIFWGEECLRKMIGMFSFAIYDRKLKNLFCVKDQFGMKPLFYYYDNKKFIFSSEIYPILALLKNKPKLNLQRSYDYLLFGNQDNQEDTFIDKIKQIGAGNILKFNHEKNSLNIKRWWYPSINEREDINFEHSAKQLKEKFLEKVKIHLRSDVPIGIALSGGIDSSSIACAVRHLYPDYEINTFSYLSEDSSLNEKKWIENINNFTKSKSNFIFAENDFSKDLDDVIKIQGEPFLDTSIITEYLIFKKAKEKGIKVMLEGQGGDELLCGYNGYPGSRLYSLFLKNEYKKFFTFSKNWTKINQKKIYQLAFRFGQEVLSSNAKNIALKIIGKDFAPKWLNTDYLKKQNLQFQSPENIIINKFPGRMLISKLRENIFSGGLPALLRYADRSSMAFSIECRLPFLTKDFSEYIFSLPERFLISDQAKTKHIFREAMRGIVPDTILDRNDKIGFATPEARLLRNVKSQIAAWLDDDYENPLINKNFFKQEILNTLNGQKSYDNQVWRMINFYRWSQLMELN